MMYGIMSRNSARYGRADCLHGCTQVGCKTKQQGRADAPFGFNVPESFCQGNKAVACSHVFENASP